MTSKKNDRHDLLQERSIGAEILEEVGGFLQDNATLIWDDFDGPIRQCLHAIHGNGGLDKVRDALDVLHRSTHGKSRGYVRNWSGYINKILKGFLKDLVKRADSKRGPSSTFAASSCSALLSCMQIPMPMILSTGCSPILPATALMWQGRARYSSTRDVNSPVRTTITETINAFPIDSSTTTPEKSEMNGLGFARESLDLPEESQKLSSKDMIPDFDVCAPIRQTSNAPTSPTNSPVTTMEPVIPMIMDNFFSQIMLDAEEAASAQPMTELDTESFADTNELDTKSLADSLDDEFLLVTGQLEASFFTCSPSMQEVEASEQDTPDVYDHNSSAEDNDQLIYGFCKCGPNMEEHEQDGFLVI